MNIAEEVSFDKFGNIEKFPLLRKLFLALIIILVAALSFGIGRLTVAGDREAIKIEYDSSISNQASVSSALNNIENSSSVVASKNGTKYHYSHCAGAKQIREENKIIFSSPEAAEASGYTLAANCKPQ
ncbi:MAG: hypothetical protein HYT69_00155 [Candidatus Zambryskibacteria bacterium]|nr:hypothetical protein [Candidatus Zambryskibacteria bacterium]